MLTEVRIRVITSDRDLRAWVVDELALMSPTIEVQTADTLDAADADLLIVGLDALPAAAAERLRELSIPVIGIGAPPSVLAGSSVCVLDAKLTSKQLKRAVRDSLALPHLAPRSLQPA
jgi:hypothetical protein